MARQKARTREFRKKKDWKERWREGGAEGERGAHRLGGRGQPTFRTYRGEPLRETKL